MNIKENFSNMSIWFRLFWMAFYILVLYILGLPILLLIMIFQFFSFLVTGAINTNLNNAAKYVAEYITDIIMYLTYVSEDKPFPLNSEDNKVSVSKSKK